MKKLYFLLLLIVMTSRMNAQSVSLVTVTPPCDSNGVIVASFTGLTLPVIIYWYAGGIGVTDTITSGTTDTLFNFMGGYIYVTAANGADTSINASTTSPAFVASPFSIASTMTPGICPGLGSENATISGGTPPYTYQWINTSTSTLVATGNPASLPAGYYKVKATDAAGCFTYLNGLNVTIGLGFSIDSTGGLVTASAICPSLGSATVTPTGGIGPFTYIWTNSSGTVVGIANPMALPGGSYHVTATESTGCSETRYFNIYTVPDFTVSTATTPAVCPATGSATVTVTGGVAPFTYSWTNSSGTLIGTSSSVSGITTTGYYYYSISDATGCSGTGSVNIVVNNDFTLMHTTTAAICPGVGSASAVIGGGTAPFTYQWINSSGTIISTTTPASLPAGHYDLVVTDGLGCSATDDSVYIYMLPDFTATVSPTSATCTNGTATAYITGGVPPFSYLWSNGAVSSAISSLMPGYYYVSITDALGCVMSSVGTYVAQGVTITVSTIETPTTCVSHSGATTATPYGGMAPYTYLWNNGATTPTISGIDGGSYHCTITDVNSCKGTGYSYVGTIIPISVTPPTVTASACSTATGTANIATITGGTPPYAITWYTTPMQTGYTATGLAAGGYGYQVIDATGCVKYSTVYIPPVYAVSLSLTATPATCTLHDGSVIADATGGVTPYSYVWTGGSSATATLSGVGSGHYHVVVTDANGCHVSDDQEVPTFSPLSVGLSSTPASCLFVANGSFTATALGGTAPYTYSMGGTSSGSVTISSLITGHYGISVTDASGCHAWTSGSIGHNTADSSCYCTIIGTVFSDLNSNCIQDAGEVGRNGVQIHAANYEYTYTDAAGHYAIIVPSGTYTVVESEPFIAGYSLAACQPNYIPYIAVAASGCSTVINFADTLNPVAPPDTVHDLSVSTWDYNRPVPGFAYNQVTVIRNNGSFTEPGVQASYWADGTIFAPTITPSGSYSGAPYWYNAASLPSLPPGSAQSFLMDYFVPASVPLGTILVFKDTVSNTAPLSGWLTDNTPWNNVDYFNPYVVGPYDPNFKEVKPTGLGSMGLITHSDSVLQYMVHFQNTGTYPAQNVVVTDTLDPNLDWTSLSPIYASANCKVDMDENGHVTFTFKNIYLPPSSSEPITSGGFFVYSIKLKPALPIGTQIRNSASIYFDFNAPVKTESTLNTICSFPDFVNNVTVTTAKTFSIYPNPADNTCSVALNNDASGAALLSIVDVAGRVIMNKDITLTKGSQHIGLDLNTFAPGVYFVTLHGPGNPQTQKLVILK